MLAGPIFTRETLTSPRQARHFLIRAGYVFGLMILIYTSSQATFGWQQAKSVGDLARFGSLLFQIFSVVQLSLMLFFALLFSASSVAQEKDRGTLILLLLTDLRERELVLGKLFASLLIVFVTWAASIPVFLSISLFGGVSLDQIFWSLAISGVTILAAGSWGGLVGYWREKTFQTLSVSVLGAVVFLGAVYSVSQFFPGPVGEWIAALNPYHAMAGLLNPFANMQGVGVASVSGFKCVIALTGLSAVLNVATMFSLRRWNTLRFSQPREETEAATGQSRVKVREIWANPVLWREIRTRAYGRKVIAIKLAYLVLAAFAFYSLILAGSTEPIVGIVQPSTLCFVGLTVLSLTLINAQAVTSITSEKDAKTLILLLATDLSAKEFVYGKLGGILYNTKELILVPMLLLGYFAVTGSVGAEYLIYLSLGYLTLVGFSAALGLHSGMGFENSRSAIANSLGTMFFLFVGIFLFMVLLLEARSSFFVQFQSFVLFIGVGSIGLYASLTHNNPSSALTLAAGSLPMLTFWAITEFLLGGSLGVTIAIVGVYGFTTIAMFIPAVSEFDSALGRTTLGK